MDNISSDPKWQEIEAKHIKETYLCDPTKNKECAKGDICYYNPSSEWPQCTRTKHKEYAHE